MQKLVYGKTRFEKAMQALYERPAFPPEAEEAAKIAAEEAAKTAALQAIEKAKADKTKAEDISNKLTEPSSNLAVGKYFRIASIDNDGHAVLECVDRRHEHCRPTT